MLKYMKGYKRCFEGQAWMICTMCPTYKKHVLLWPFIYLYYIRYLCLLGYV